MNTTQHTIALSRPLPGEFAVPGAEIRTGPARGFATRDELASFMAGAHAVVTWVSERVDGAFLDAVGEQLKIVSNFAVGYDNIDVPVIVEVGLIGIRDRGTVVEVIEDAVIVEVEAHIGVGDRKSVV